MATMMNPLDSPTSTFSTDSSGPVPVGPNGAWASKTRTWIPRPDDTTAHPNRTLVLCFDGTGDQFDNDNSNIVQLMSLLKKDDPTKQLVYYQTGIGTYSEADVRIPAIRKISQAVDLMFATTLGHHIRDGYEFVMQNYKDGDVICIFGFSRGAYTARALAGMLQKVGLLPAWNRQLLPFAYHMYSKTDAETLTLCKDFKATFSIDVKIEFVGVFDTVASVGLVPRYLPFVNSNSSIRFFRHALALDEHRAKFAPSYYRQSRTDESAGLDDWDAQNKNGAATLVSEDGLPSPPPMHVRGETQATLVQSPSPMGGIPEEYKSGGATMPMPSPPLASKTSPATTTSKSRRYLKHREHSQAYLFENALNAEEDQHTDSLEVWFSGAHCDVGGGSVGNHTRNSLARIPLRWMIRECFRARTGIIFDAQMLRDVVGMDVDLDALRIMEQPARRSPLNERAEGEGHAEIARDPNANRHGFFVSTAKSAGWVLLSPVTLVLRGLRAVFRSRSAAAIRLPVQDAPPAPFADEATEELRDALSPMYDQLKEAPKWWFLEWLPLRVKKERAIYESSDRADDYTWLVNRGEGRKVFKFVVHRGMKVHRSVLTRLEAVATREEDKYVPLIRPNFVKRQGGGEKRIRFRRMTHEEWKTQKAEGLEEEWFQWV